MVENSFNINGAGLEDGTLDFYTLIQEPVDADTETLRGKIQSLYNEAQANRDHRNLTKRREFQTLLELLPRARMTLLEPEKRARYNAYLASAKSGTAEVEFETFMNDLLGLNETMEEKTGLLGVQDKPSAPRARVIKTPTEPAPKATLKTSSSPSSPSTTAIGGAVVGFIIGAVLGKVILHSVVPALLLGILLAALAYVALNSNPKTGIRS